MLTVLRKYNSEFWTSELRFQTGRAALYNLLSLQKFSRVILPSYCPEGLLQPCIQAKVETVFYRLYSDLTPDLESLASQLTKDALVIVVNYFGYPTPLHLVKACVVEARAILLEDCAHCLYGEATKARNADIGLWSLNKFLPVADGAIIRSRAKGIDLFRSPRLLVGSNPGGRAHYLKHLELNAKIADKGALVLEGESEAAYDEYYTTITDCLPIEQSMYSRLIEAQFDYEKEEKVRSTNAWRLSMSIKGLRDKGLPQFAYPVVVKQPETVRENLIKIGVLPSVLGNKWHVVDHKYRAETHFAERHLLLPLGEPMDTGVVHKIAEVVS